MFCRTLIFSIYTPRSRQVWSHFTFKTSEMLSYKNATERVVAIKAAQEKALAQLPLNSLYVVLYIRSDPPRSNDFHWAYYLHTASRGGTKFHVRNIGAGWISGHGQTCGIFKSAFLCVLIHITTIPHEKLDLVDQIMRSHDSNLNSMPNITCRVWLMTVLKDLIENELVRCINSVELQQECFDFGNEHSSSAAINEQPRPVVKSKFCN